MVSLDPVYDIKEIILLSTGQSEVKVPATESLDYTRFHANLFIYCIYIIFSFFFHQKSGLDCEKRWSVVPDVYMDGWMKLVCQISSASECFGI